MSLASGGSLKKELSEAEKSVHISCHRFHLDGYDMGLSENRVYSQWNSHFIGIMISKTIGYNGVFPIFRHTHMSWRTVLSEVNFCWGKNCPEKSAACERQLCRLLWSVRAIGRSPTWRMGHQWVGEVLRGLERCLGANDVAHVAGFSMIFHWSKYQRVRTGKQLQSQNFWIAGSCYQLFISCLFLNTEKTPRLPPQDHWFMGAGQVFWCQ